MRAGRLKRFVLQRALKIYSEPAFLTSIQKKPAFYDMMHREE